MTPPRRRPMLTGPVLTPCATCTHPRSEHHPELPSPCGRGHNEDAIVAAMGEATASGGCPVRVAQEAMDAEYAAGACRCTGFTEPNLRVLH
jgi:hypothetical protein